jgi:16S rRNA (uracil1498-N3)-methyltransferase
MRISRIYFDGVLAEGMSICFPLDVSHYIMNVLRLKIGANLIVFNGKGGEFNAIIKVVEKKGVTAQIQQYKDHSTESPLSIHLAQAISRSEKMDLILQKAVELGVNKVTPLITEFCNIQLNEDRAAKRFLHWQKVLISACEQSGRTYVPSLEPIQKFQVWLKKNLAPLRLFCDPRSDQRLASLSRQQEVVLLIGPEGGFSSKEIDEAKAHNFLGISLGPRILRTETAPLAAITILQSYWGDM